MSFRENIAIYVNLLQNHNLHSICTQIHVFEQFLVRHDFLKWAWLNDRARERADFGLKSCAMSEKKSHKAARSEYFARESYRELRLGGGHYGPPPALLGLSYQLQT